MANERILIVEDEIIIAEGIKNDLEMFGYEVPDVAMSGEQAIQKSVDLKPDLILMDIVLQGNKDGVEAAVEIKELVDVPVVYLTAYANQKTAERIKVSQPSGYVMKPYQPQELYTAIEMAIYNHQMEQNLQRSQSLLSITLNSINDAVLTIDTSGDIMFINPAAEALIGCTDAEALNEHVDNIMQFVDEHSEERLVNPGLIALREGVEVKPKQHPVLINKKFDRLPVKVIGRPILGESDEISGAVLVLKDATEERSTRQRLSQFERRYYHLFEEFRETAFIGDGNGYFTDINKAGVELFEYDSREKLLRTSFAERLFANREDWTKYTKKLKAGAGVKDFETILRTDKGNKLYVVITARAIMDNDGNLVKHHGIIRDVTARRQLQKQIFENKKMEGLGRLAGGIAHDFNNILTGILGYASMMKAGIEEHHEFFDYIVRIEKSSQRAAELTDKLLGFARGGDYNMQPIDVNRMILDSRKVIRSTLHSGIKIDLQLYETPLIIHADPMQLQQVLMNLCANANDAMSNEGKFKVSTELVYRPDKGKDPESLRPYVSLKVEDTGVGVPADLQEKIFEPFFTTKVGSRGRGLGLSLVYGVVKNQGGYIRLKSKSGRGTAFTLLFPYKDEKPEEDMGGIGLSAPRGGNETILVVDDEESVRMFLQDLLESFGYNVVMAEDGERGVELYRDCYQEIDLIVLDMVMPRMGGKQAFKKLKEINPDLKVVVATGFSQNSEVQEILQCGAKGFVKKPYMISEFLGSIRNLLDS